MRLYMNEEYIQLARSSYNGGWWFYKHQQKIDLLADAFL